MERKRIVFVVLPLILILAAILPASAASTTKTLSTNFTLVNLGTGAANGINSYYKPDGTSWRADETFSIPTVGGQAVFRQYLDGTLPAGTGSVVVSSDQALGSVVQILARGQTPSSGAYVGVVAGSTSTFLPLVARHGTSASGTVNSVVTIQNTSSAASDVLVTFYNASDGQQKYQKTISALAASASSQYDLETETNLGENWFGSAVVTAQASGGQVTAVSSMFMGADTMQVVNSFVQSAPTTSWIVPQFIVRLTNGLSSPVTVQNVSGSPIAANAVTLACKVASNSPSATPATINLTNATAIGNNQSYSWNPVVDTTNFPTANWQGSCLVTAPANVVTFIQNRFIGQSRADSYQALPANGTDKKVIVPLVAKRLTNGFATAVVIANLNPNAAATVSLSYKPAAESPSQATLDVASVSIPAGGNLVQNQRVVYSPSDPSTVNLPDNWQGTLTVTSTDQPINAYVQLDFLGQPGDPYMTHNAFTQP